MARREDCNLRPMTNADLMMVREWRNSDRVRPFMYTTHLITEEEHQAWWEGAKNSPSARYYIFEMINRPIGAVNFVEIDSTHGTASWGYYLGEEEVPLGAGSAMEYCALEEAFERLRIRKLMCEVFANNSVPLKLHGKFGFQQEGLRLKHKLHDGVYEDIHELALFGDQWPKIAEKMASRVFRG